MSGGTAGPIEVYHALCLFQGAEPLRTPLAGIVGGLVTDFDSHGLFAVVSILQGRRVQSRSEMCQRPHCPWGRVASHLANHAC